MTIYRLTQDEHALRHIKNIIYLYLNTVNKDTGMFGGMFTCSNGAPGTNDIETTFGPNWWTWVRYDQVNGQNWGDRDYNQIAPMLIAAGRITEDRRGEILEANGAGIARNFQVKTMEAAQVFGRDTELGRDIESRVIKHNAGVIKYFYDFENNLLPSMAYTNGVHAAGLRAIRPGYYGNVGTYYGYTNVSIDRFVNFVKIYLMAADREDLQKDLDIMWSAIVNICKKGYNLGDIGNPTKNISPKLNMGTTSAKPELIRILLSLYGATGNREYLNQARVIGNNIVNSVYKHGYFLYDTEKRYINTDGEYHYVLLKLEEALRGESGLVPESSHTNSIEMQANYYDENMRYWNWNDSDMVLYMTYNNVAVTDILVYEEEVLLEVGEKHQINYKIEPDDATSNAVMWNVQDRSIADISDNGAIIAKRSGETVAYAVASSVLGVTSKPLKIVVR